MGHSVAALPVLAFDENRKGRATNGATNGATNTVLREMPKEEWKNADEDAARKAAIKKMKQDEATRVKARAGGSVVEAAPQVEHIPTEEGAEAQNTKGLRSIDWRTLKTQMDFCVEFFEPLYVVVNQLQTANCGHAVYGWMLNVQQHFNKYPHRADVVKMQAKWKVAMDESGAIWNRMRVFNPWEKHIVPDHNIFPWTNDDGRDDLMKDLNAIQDLSHHGSAAASGRVTR